MSPLFSISADKLPTCWYHVNGVLHSYDSFYFERSLGGNNQQSDREIDLT